MSFHTEKKKILHLQAPFCLTPNDFFTTYSDDGQVSAFWTCEMGSIVTSLPYGYWEDKVKSGYTCWPRQSKNLPAMWEIRVWSWVGKSPWRRAWQSTPILLPEESHGQRGLLGYSLQGCKESDMTQRLTNTQSEIRDLILSTGANHIGRTPHKAATILLLSPASWPGMIENHGRLCCPRD